jgi:hypothetical protein
MKKQECLVSMNIGEVVRFLKRVNLLNLKR